MSNSDSDKPPQGLLPTKSQKSRRKISLPWFRQNSVTNPKAALSRQHTIDSPGSFRFFRQPSTNTNQVHIPNKHTAICQKYLLNNNEIAIKTKNDKRNNYTIRKMKKTLKLTND